jgi:hypothetical protein
MKGGASYATTRIPNHATVHKAHMTSLVLNYLDSRKTSEDYTGHETWALYSSL